MSAITQLTQKQRYQIYALLKAGHNQTEIAHFYDFLERLPPWPELNVLLEHMLRRPRPAMGHLDRCASLGRFSSPRG